MVATYHSDHLFASLGHSTFNLVRNFLFNISIRDNIALAKSDATSEEIMNAAMLAGATEFINDMPEGFDTMVEERGASLSGGQRQRIAIARALLTNPQILILDEATSALDYKSERIIKQNLNAIRKGRTVIIIAHRLTTVQSCDQIFVLDKGKLIERGNHNELLRKDGVYAHLVKQQESETFAGSGNAQNMNPPGAHTAMHPHASAGRPRNITAGVARKSAPALPQGSAPALPQGTAGIPQGTAGVPQGTAGIPQGSAPALPQGSAPGIPQGTAGIPQGSAPALPPLGSNLR